MSESIPHLIRSYETVEIDQTGKKTIINVVTDLPISSSRPSFDEEAFRDFTNDLVGRYLADGSFDRIELSYDPGTTDA